MTKNEYNFTLDELSTFIHKKKCPHCGNKDMERHTHKFYKGSKKSTFEQMNLMTEEVYENIFIYECKVCNRKYTLTGLKNNIELDVDSFDTIHNETKHKNDNLIERQNKNNSNGKLIIKRFALIWLVVAMLIVLSTSIKDNNYAALLIFSPFILFVYGAFRFFSR